MTTVERINELRGQRAIVATQLETLDAEIARLIRQALSEGCRPTELAKAIGITRGRIYQILEKRNPG